VAALIEWRLLRGSSLFWMDGPQDVALPLVVAAAVLAATWRWFDGRRGSEDVRLHAGQIAVWWAWAVCVEVFFFSVLVWVDLHFSGLSAEGARYGLFLSLLIFVWVPARMLKVTWDWVRTRPKPGRASESMG
jgi:hypothetical protein